MSTANPAQPPGQPQSKAAAVAELSGPAVQSSDDEVSARLAEGTRVRFTRSVKEELVSDPTSLPATIALIQRVLTPEKHAATTDWRTRPSIIEEILPPLTSSNDIDVELYAILAIIVKDFVNTWYTKITQDHSFVEEIIRIVAHCCRALEQRLRNVDVTTLLLDEVPSLIREHYEAYRKAKALALTSPYDLDARQVYHGLNPHPALSPLPFDGDETSELQQAENERAYRQLLIQGSLAVLLPTEDLQNDPLRVFVGDIAADLIVGQALSAKVCDGWFLHEAICKVTAALSDKVHSKATGNEIRDDAKGRLEKFGLLSSEAKSSRHHSSNVDQSRIAAWFWRIMQYGYLLYLFLRSFLKELQTLGRRPKRHTHARISPSTPTTIQKGRLQDAMSDDPSAQPVLAFRFFNMISTLLNTAACMPWLASMLAFWQHILLNRGGRFGRFNSVLDRFLYHAIETHVLPSSLLPVVLRNLRAALFPNNTIGPPAPPSPSPEERIAIKHRAAILIHAFIPATISQKYYATNNNERVIETIEKDLLDPLDDLYLNKHLIFGILELILVRLIPELAELSISDLLLERGVAWDLESTLGENERDQAEVIHAEKR